MSYLTKYSKVSFNFLTGLNILNRRLNSDREHKEEKIENYRNYFLNLKSIIIYTKVF